VPAAEQPPRQQVEQQVHRHAGRDHQHQGSVRARPAPSSWLRRRLSPAAQPCRRFSLVRTCPAHERGGSTGRGRRWRQPAGDGGVGSGSCEAFPLWREPWIPAGACPRMLLSGAGMTHRGMQKHDAKLHQRIDHRSSIIDHRSSIIDHRSPITDHRSPITAPAVRSRASGRATATTTG
jgi:hypothetical protein